MDKTIIISKSELKKLINLIKGNFLKLFLAMFCMMIVAATTSATAFLIKPMLDDIFFKKNNEMLILIPLLIIAVYLLRGIAAYGQNYFMHYVGEVIIKKLRDMLYDKIINLPLAFFQKKNTGDLMSRVSNDTNLVKAMVSSAITGVLRHSFTIFGLIGVIFYRDFKLAFYAIIVLPAAFYPIVIFGRKLRKISTGWQETTAEVNTFLQETFVANKIIKTFVTEKQEAKRFFEKTRKLFKLYMKSVVVQSLSSPIMEILAGFGIAFIIWFGGLKVIEGSSTPGTFFSFMAATLMLYEPIKKMSTLNTQIQEGLSAMTRIFDVIERKNEIIDNTDSNAVDIDFYKKNMEFDSVVFKYDKLTILKNINLKVEYGNVIALVGMSGGGKTSFVNLIPRFYDVSSGEIKIDGINIKNIKLETLRKQISIVTQEPILFNDTIRNNICYGTPSATDKDIEKAAKDSYAYDFIQSFPKKFDTTIGELGSRLSGGEKQRICIARAIIKNAPILILDEATSSLDAEAEKVVQKALENLMIGKTTFLIAHRLSTVINADRILVLDKGEIIEQGSHKELLEKKGKYYKLYENQFK